MNLKHTTGYILAGGKSLRMGHDKGLKSFKGKMLVENIIDQMLPVFEKVVIVSNNLAYDQFGLEVVEDLVKGIGPAGGIYTALQHSVTDTNFIVSCDMPFIHQDAIHYMMDHGQVAEITLPKMNEKLEPLFGIYSKKCLLKWKELIDQQCIKVQDMVSNFDLNIIDVNELAMFQSTLFFNINTPEDFNQALKN